MPQWLQCKDSIILAGVNDTSNLMCVSTVPTQWRGWMPVLSRVKAIDRPCTRPTPPRRRIACVTLNIRLAATVNQANTAVRSCNSPTCKTSGKLGF